MMFPSAVEGHMPFIDRYKQEQINKVIRKADRQRRHSGGAPSADPAAARAVIAKETKGRSLPALSHAGSQRPRFISMPEMAAAQPEVQKANSRHGKHSLLSSLKKMFSGKSKAKADDRPASASPLQQPQPPSSHATSYSDHKGKPHDRVTVTGFHSRKGLLAVGSVTVGGDAKSHSRKTSRARTVSNISTVMETIVEQNESTCSREQLSSGDDEDESGSSSGADSSGHGSSGHGCGHHELPSADAGDCDSSTEGYDSS